MPRDPQALEAVLRVAIVPGIGPARLAALLKHFGGVEAVLRAPARDVAALPGFGPELARRVASAGTDEGLRRARTAYQALRRVGAVVLTADDDVYPAAFRALPDPPLVLYALGDAHLLGDPGIGVVGTREPTDYGRRTAAGLARELARAGYSIVSGMARGIDAVAQAAALDAGGATVGVLGHGIDRVYPEDNRPLFGRVRERGLLITELPPGEEPLAGNFPRRNRLIAALSAGVLVVEMGERSGARHTVDYALELGREVFAVPGPIGSPASAGTNQLLKDGARLVTSARDVLEELQGVGLPPRAGFIPAPGSGVAPAAEAAPPVRPPPPPDLAPDESRVLAQLADEPRHVDDLAAALAMPTRAALTALLGLELRELVEALPGKQFRLR